MARCKHCGDQIKALRSKTFCGTECYNADRDQRAEARMTRDQQLHYNSKPMPRTQALANAYLTDRSLQSIDELIGEVFNRPVEER